MAFIRDQELTNVKSTAEFSKSGVQAEDRTIEKLYLFMYKGETSLLGQEVGG